MNPSLAAFEPGPDTMGMAGRCAGFAFLASRLPVSLTTETLSAVVHSAQKHTL